MKLAICVPVRDTVHSTFAYCLNELTSHLVRSNVDYNLFFQNGSVLPEQRTALVSSALNAKCDYILWLDSDMVFPKNLYQRLSSHNYDIVACTYSTRTKPYRNVAFLTHDFNDRLTASLGVHKVSSVGMGLMLTNIDGQPYAVKYVAEDPRDGLKEIRDIDTARRIKHPNAIHSDFIFKKRIG
jgi:choline kinase